MKLLAPNGKPSNLIGIKAEDENGKWVYLYDLVRSNKFKEFFGDWEEAYITKDYDYVSKIIDENGEPNICYHSTSNEFFEFDENYIGSKTDSGYYGKGFYFTEGVANSRYGEREIPCFLNIRNPLSYKSINRTNVLNTNELKDKGYDGVLVFDNWVDVENIDLTLGLGYHGNNIQEIVAYYPEQIKLADATNTTFDRYDSDIRYAGGGKFKKGGAVIEYDDKIFYHGTDSYFQKFDLSKAGSGEGSNKLGEAIYLTPDLEKAKEYGSIILEVVLRKGLKLIDYDQIKHQKGYYNFLDKQKKEDISIAKENLARLKFDGMFYGSKELIIFNEKNVKVIGKAYKKGGSVKNLSKTPAPKKDRIYGSKVNKPKSSASKSKASSIILNPTVIKSINTILKEHNEDFQKKKIPLSTAKAVVRRGMGAFSSSYRPTISGGKPNSRVAWGLARLKAFVYKIQKGHSKSGKYKQDNDLIDELGYKHDEYKKGGEIVYHGSPYDFEEFTTSTIGTGEGASGWGYGLYFSEDKDEANDYACKLERERKDGRLYTAKIPESEKFLDFHADFDEQTDYVKKALISMSKKYKIELSEGEYQENLERINEDIDEYDFKIGDDDYWELINYVLEPQILFKQNYIYDWIKDILFEGYEYEASEFLYKLGIKGIKHSAFGYVNYVVFNEDDIKLLNKKIAKCNYKFGGKINPNEVSKYLKYNNGGQMENDKTFILTTYFVSAETDTDSSNIYKGTDYERAKLEFDSANITDFDGGNGGMVLFQKVIDKYKFIGDLEDGYYEISDFPIEDYYNDKDYYKIIENGEFEHIDSKDVAHINNESDDLLHDVESYYQKTYGNWKYNKIIVDNGKDENDDYYKEYGCIQLRITNHSENVINNDKFGSCDYYISVVIANKNPTKDKFLTSMYERRRNEIELRFNSDNSFDEIINEIDSEIANGKLYIAEKLDISVNDIYINGGELVYNEGGGITQKNNFNNRFKNLKLVGGNIESTKSDDFVELKYIQNGKKLGYLNYYFDTDGTLSPYLNYKNELYIDMVQVKSQYRGKGIAKQLINKAIEDAKKLGIQVVTLKRDVGMGCLYGSEYDTYLKKIYSSIGFVETWTEKESEESGGEKNICAMHYTTFDSNNTDIRYELGGEITLTTEQVEQKLGRKLHWWNDDIVYLSGIKYKKVYLRPEYKKIN